MAAKKKQRSVRLADVAQRAGVSRVAVSHVLHGSGKNVRVSEATREKVLRVARQLNYGPTATRSSCVVRAATPWG